VWFAKRVIASEIVPPPPTKGFAEGLYFPREPEKNVLTVHPPPPRGGKTSSAKRIALPIGVNDGLREDRWMAPDSRTRSSKTRRSSCPMFIIKPKSAAKQKALSVPQSYVGKKKYNRGRVLYKPLRNRDLCSPKLLQVPPPDPSGIEERRARHGVRDLRSLNLTETIAGER